MNASEWGIVINQAFESQGLTYTSELIELMNTPPDPTTKGAVKFKAVEVTNALNRYLWLKVIDGKTFGNTNRIKENYGKSIEENYGISSGPFADLARAYWTFKIELGDLYPEHHNTWLTESLKAVEINLRYEFFPSPGEDQISPMERKVIQSETLSKFAPSIEIPHFMRDNPFVRANSQMNNESSGCLGVTASILITIGVFVYATTQIILSTDF